MQQCCIYCVPEPWKTFITSLHVFLCSITVICSSNLPILYELPCTLPLIVFQGALTKAQRFLQASNSSLVLHSQRRSTFTDTGEGWVHSVAVVFNRISQSTVTNQLLKHVKNTTERSQQRPCVKWCGSQCCGKQAEALCVHSGHEVTW